MTVRTIFEGGGLNQTFELALALKGVFAFFEVAGGIGIYLVDRNYLTNLVLSTFHNELQRDPHDFIVSTLLHAAQALSLSSQVFISLYLLASGLTKVVLIAGLLRRKLTYYPTAIGVFLLFVAYQLYQYSISRSIWMLLLTLVDFVVIWLTWREFKLIRKRLS